MIHDRWDQALFLHWRVPPELESVLENDAAPFQLDRYDGSTWIGLVLLTEINVGPAAFRSKRSCVTHHGINVRTYVLSPSVKGETNDNQKCSTTVNGENGIHFSSLECNDEFTAYGANYFGMPYRVADITRKMIPPEGIELGTDNNCEQRKSYMYQIESYRWKSAVPSLLRVLLRALPIPRFASLGQYSRRTSDDQDTSADFGSSSAVDSSPINRHTSSGFSVKCTWKIRGHNDSIDESFARWAIERYFVYTRKYGLSWRGQVEHKAWPDIQDVDLHQFWLGSVDTYEPAAMRPILDFMATHTPDSALFSPGVGPVAFRMLQTVS